MGEQSLFEIDNSGIDNFYNDLVAEVESVTDYQQYIHEVLLPMMDQHRGRTEPAPKSKIMQRLFSTDPEKPGEMIEFFEAAEDAARKGQKITPEKALEIADLIYFMEQPGGRHLLYGSDESGKIVADPYGLVEETLGVDIDTARLFCMIKYRTRIHYTPLVEDEDRKEIEKAIMARLLKRLGLDETIS